MGQLLLGGIIVVSLLVAFWINARTTSRRNLAIQAPEEELDVFGMVGVSITTPWQTPKLWLFGCAISCVSNVTFWVFPSGFTSSGLADLSISALHSVPPSLAAVSQKAGLQACTEFVRVWIQIALTFAALVTLRGNSFRFAEVLRSVRRQWKASVVLACLYATSGFLSSAAMMLMKWRPIFFILGLPIAAWIFSLGLAIPVLANESAGGLTSVRRSWTLLSRAWGARLFGLAAIGLPFIGLAIVGGLFMTHFLGSPTDTDLISRLSFFVTTDLFLLMTVFGSVVSQIFDTCLYLTLVGSKSLALSSSVVKLSSSAI
jgi:Family of unknown function (DUF6159)